MVDPVTRGDMEPDDPRDGPPKKTPEQIVQYWLDAIQSAEKRRKAYWVRGRQIIKRYKNKRTLTTLGVPIANRRMNVLWSNVQTQKPVLYSQTPQANVSRRNKSKDPVGRTAAIVLQNCLQNSLGMEDFDYVMNQVTEDRLLPGAGVAMVEYVPQVEQDQVGWQAAETRYIHWEDWLTNPARTWQENWFFAYKVFLTRTQARDAALNGAKAQGMDEEEANAFASDVWREITLDHKEDKKEESKRDETGPAKATVWVIWDQTDKQVIQLATGYPKAPLAVLPPPVNFDNYWPIPRPLQSTTTNDSTIPIPDFEQYVDQADEIDLMTQRIGTLSKALRLRGLYPADMDSLKMLVDGGDADMIPYDNWQLLQEKGGAEALVVWFPIEAIAKTLQYCMEARDKAIDIMYQITGISDIQRGDTDPDETKGAQQLKAQFGSIRTRTSQREVQRFIRDLLRLKAEVICEHFTLDVIQKMSGVKILAEQQKQMVQQALQMWGQYQQQMQQFQEAQQQVQQPKPGMPPAAAPMALTPPPPPGIPQPPEEMVEALKEPSWEQVMKVLRDEKLRGFIVDVETDSTIEPDQQAQQAAATEFVQAVTAFMTAAAPIIQMEPDAAPLMGEMLSWAANQWKGADTIVGAVDEFTDVLKKKAEQAAQNPPPPDPKLQAEQVKAGAEVQKAQADVTMTQMQAQATAQQTQLEAAVDKQQAQIDMIMAQLKLKTEMLGHENDMERLKAERAAAKAEPKETADG